MRMILVITWIIILVCLSINFTCYLKIQNTKPNWMRNKDLLNMSNTVNPIIAQIARQLCEYKRVQYNTGENNPAKGGSLIYKREPVKSCISGTGNVYYIRCYEWGWKNDKLWYKPIRDIPVGSYSCIDEKDVNIPYWDEQLQKAELGVKYWVQGITPIK